MHTHLASYLLPPPQVQLPLGENWNVTDLNLGRPTRTPSKELLRNLYLQRLRALRGIDEMLDTLGKPLLPGTVLGGSLLKQLNLNDMITAAGLFCTLDAGSVPESLSHRPAADPKLLVPWYTCQHVPTAPTRAP